MATISVLHEKCTLCKLCIKACPSGSIKLENDRIVILENCTLCSNCVSTCKFEAISLTKESRAQKDLSAYRGVWVIGEQNNGQISPVTFELLGKGKTLAAELNVTLSSVMLGNNIKEKGQDLIAHGADQAYIVDNQLFEDFNDEYYSTVLVELLKEHKPEIVLIGATAYGRSLAPRIASLLDTGLTADCTGLEIDSENRNLLQTRPAFGGNLMATIVCPNHRPQMATVRPKVMKALEADPAREGKIIEPEITAPAPTKLLIKKVSEKVSSEVNLVDSEVIVALGRGIDGSHNLPMIKKLADLLGGVVAASRTAVDLGWVQYEHQVGQTGKTVCPKIYIACGISGAIQHLAGMMSSEIIIAINKDPEAPIFKVANYGLVGDAQEIIPMLIEEIEKGKK